MDTTLWQEESVWSANYSIDYNSIISSNNVLLIHCPMCPFFTFNYKRLLEHLATSTHTGTLECVFYRCNECHKISTSSVLLKEHFCDEHSNIITKHSTPISCLGVQRFTDKKSLDINKECKSDSNCIFCTYQGNDLSNHYSTEHNILTGPNKLLKPALNSPFNQILSTNPNPMLNGDMKMLDGTLIVLPEAPQETSSTNGISPLNSKGSRKRKMNLPISSADNNNNNNNGVHMDESDESDSNSENFNNQFVSTTLVDSHVIEESPSRTDQMAASFIDSHITNVLATDDDSSEHSSDISRPINGELHTQSSGYAIRSSSNGNRTMTMYGPSMMRKRGRPPKISSQVLTKEEIEIELGPHVESVGKIDDQDSVRIAVGEPFEMVVPLSLLIGAFDSDGVQYLKNLIRLYYKPEQLALFAWDVTQKRGRPRTSIAICSDPNSSDVSNIKLQSLRQQTFVQASMRLIEQMFGEPFPSNLPLFINRLLQSHRFYIYGTTPGATAAGVVASSSITSATPLISSDTIQHSVSSYRDTETRLSRFWIQCSDSDKLVRLTASCPPIQKSLLISSFDTDSVRFFRNLVRSVLPLEELLHATWKGRNTGRPRLLSALTNDECNDDSVDDNKRPLIEHPLVQAFLDFVPRVCGRALPENLGPVIHQLLATVRKTHCNNGMTTKSAHNGN